MSDHDDASRPPELIHVRQGPGRYLPLAEAAERLGLHVDALRRRAKSGAVDARQVKRPQGVAYEVWIPDDMPAPEPAEDDATSRHLAPPGGQQQALARILSGGFVGEITDLAQRAADAEAKLRIEEARAAARAKVQRLEARLAESERKRQEAEAKLAELEAREAILSSHPPNYTAPLDAAVPDPPRPPWWRRLVGGG